MARALELINRESYLKKLIAFKDDEMVKVITGVRRCGKSRLLKLFVQYLQSQGVTTDQIIEINLESYEFANFTCDELYHYVKQRVCKDKKTYIFLDELQRVKNFENAVNAFRVDFDCDIYVTGSNSYLLSSEYATYLSGRCLEIKVYPLSFKEFFSFANYTIKEKSSFEGEIEKYAVNEKGEPFTLKELLIRYIRLGGLPGIYRSTYDFDEQVQYIESVYEAIFNRDILERARITGDKAVGDPILLKRLATFLSDNIGSNISLSNISKVIANEDLIADKKNPSVNTIIKYANYLVTSYFFYDIKRYDVRGKNLLKSLSKYYIIDTGLRNYLLGFRSQDMGHLLENIVYFELLRRGYVVAVGKVGDLEVDVVATKNGQKIYIQVTQSMLSEDVISRELAPLRKIDDNYQKLVLALDCGLQKDYDGIEVKDVCQWLLN